MLGKTPEYKQEKDDNFYKWKGVAPPNRTSHGIVEEDIDELLAKNIAGHMCEWLQRGAMIVCDQGTFEHGKNIGTMKQLVGTDSNGQPILKDFTF